jgi:hypothetical protein
MLMAKENGAGDSGARIEGERPKCFVIAAFGKTTDEKLASKQVLKHLIKKVLEPRGYDVKRADELAAEGLITNQIIERLLDDDLVVADLTGLNPNVFYEMAVRHAAPKPIIHLITEGVDIPFDVGNMRTIQYSVSDPDLLEAAQQELAEKVAAIEGSDYKAQPNPITAARKVAILQQSHEPELRETGAILHSLATLQDEVRALARRVDGGPYESDQQRVTVGDLSIAEGALRARLNGGTRYTTDALINGTAREVDVPIETVRIALQRLQTKKDVFREGDIWAVAPF